MGRAAKPWRRNRGKGLGHWYATIDGEQEKVADRSATEVEAKIALAARLVGGKAASPSEGGLTCVELIDKYIKDLARRLAAREIKAPTFTSYTVDLGRVPAEIKGLPASAVRPFHVKEFIASTGWGPATTAKFIHVVRRPFTWGVREGLLESDPLKGLPRPKMPRREAMLTAEQAQRLIEAATSPAFKAIMAVLIETGCRPTDARLVTANEIDWEQGTWVLAEHKTDRYTGKPKVVYMTPKAEAICREWAGRNPTGAIFRNERGRPWSPYALGQHVRRIRAKAGMGEEAVAYAIRHGFITEGLARGVTEAVMAELVGHKNTKMINEHYKKLDRMGTHLKRALGVVRPSDDEPRQ